MRLRETTGISTSNNSKFQKSGTVFETVQGISNLNAKAVY